MKEQLLKELKKYATPERKKTNEWFFKTGKGQYGHGDKFIGVSVPHIRKVAKFFTEVTLGDIEQGLKSPIHEVRLASLHILVQQYKKAEDKEKVVKFYLKHAKKANNWDLVDASAPYILGDYIHYNKKENKILYKLAKSKNLWEKRISMVSTWMLIRKGNINDCLKLAKIHLGEEHDLMHKAVGWMLREAWKQEPKRVETFIRTNYKKMPRTTLRYAIEKIAEKKRKRYLKGEF